MSNSELIRKADLALSDLQSDGGYMPAEQTDRFMEILISVPTLLRDARVIPMRSHTHKIDKIGINSRITHPATFQTELSAGNRFSPDLEQIELTTNELISEIHLGYETLEDNIEGQDMRETIMRKMGERVALDYNDLLINGDTTSADTLLAVQDGVLKLADQNIVDHGNAVLNKYLFANLQKGVPSAYRRRMSSMKYYAHENVAIDYRTIMSDRETSLGDDQIQNRQRIFPFGNELKGDPSIAYDSLIFTDPMNIIFGIWRNISIEVDKDIRARKWIIVLTARIGFQIEEKRAIVVANNVSAFGSGSGV